MKPILQKTLLMIKLLFWSFIWLPLLAYFIFDISFPVEVWLIFLGWFVYLLVLSFDGWQYLNGLLAPYNVLSALFYLSLFSTSTVIMLYLGSENLTFSWGVTLSILIIILALAMALNPDLFRRDWLGTLVLIGLFFYFFLPSAGWILMSFTNEHNWRLLYANRILLSVIIPIITSILLIFLRLKNSTFLLKIPTLILILLLPVLTVLASLSASNTMLDWYGGEQTQIIKHHCLLDKEKIECTCNGQKVPCAEFKNDEEFIILPHTNRVLRELKMDESKDDN